MDLFAVLGFNFRTYCWAAMITQLDLLGCGQSELQKFWFVPFLEKICVMSGLLDSFFPPGFTNLDPALGVVLHLEKLIDSY